MTWTCTKCGYESSDADAKCLGCGAPKPDGMSEEERGRQVRDIYQAHWTWTNADKIPEILRHSGAKARELFTPVTDKPAAQPQGGNEGKGRT